MSAKILMFPLRKPVTSLLKILENNEETYSVRCPRKGPLGAEVSLIICEQMHDTEPGLCAQNNCRKASEFQAQIAQIKARKKG